MGDRHPAPDSSSAMSVCVVKIIIVNFACSSSAIPATFGSMGLHFDVITMVMTKYPSPAAQVVGVASTLVEAFWQTRSDIFDIIVLDEKEFFASEICRACPGTITVL